MTDKNFKFCPVVNCGGYGQKGDNKYITCTHKDCINIFYQIKQQKESFNAKY